MTSKLKLSLKTSKLVSTRINYEWALPRDPSFNYICPFTVRNKPKACAQLTKQSWKQMLTWFKEMTRHPNSFLKKKNKRNNHLLIQESSMQEQKLRILVNTQRIQQSVIARSSIDAMIHCRRYMTLLLRNNLINWQLK